MVVMNAVVVVLVVGGVGRGYCEAVFDGARVERAQGEVHPRWCESVGWGHGEGVRVEGGGGGREGWWGSVSDGGSDTTLSL